MFLSAKNLPLRRRIFTGQMLAMLLLIVFCATARAQVGGIDTDPGDPGTGGKNSIQGTIYVPGGRRLDRRVKVRLRSSLGADQFQMSDDNGAFTFRRLQGGTYTVTVDAGSEFELSAETIDIIEPSRRRNDIGVTLPVYITLRPRINETRQIIGTIDASTNAMPEAARELYKQASEVAKAGDRKKAIELLNQALSIYPKFMTALNEIGVHYMNLKQYDKAKQSLQAALKIAPEAFYPRLNYGILLLNTKDYKNAAIELQQAVQKDSSSASAHLHFGRALVNLGNYNYAEKELRSAISIGGSGELIEAHRYLGIVYIETQQNQRAADELEQYLKLAPKASDADRIREIIKQQRSQAKN